MSEKERLEREHSAMANQQAVDRIKQEILTQEESDRLASVFFEDDEEITLRDGKTYKILPANLKNARRLMQLLRTVNVNLIIANFIPTDDDEEEPQRVKDLYEILSIAFSAYPEIKDNRDYLDEYVDVNIVSKIIDILIGINGIKK